MRGGIQMSATWRSMTSTVATLAARNEGICMSTLPKVFQDTIIVCRHLGVRYLRIDSLYILQVGFAKLNIRARILIMSIGL
jgi:hypothetical protein